jgi:hypothetical protein
VLSYSKDSGKRKDAEEDEALAELFQEEELPKEVIEEDIEESIVLFLWEEHFELYKMFRLLSAYFLENYRVDTALLLRLVDAKALPLEETLYNISYMHSSYLEVITPRSTPK